MHAGEKGGRGFNVAKFRDVQKFGKREDRGTNGGEKPGSHLGT